MRIVHLMLSNFYIDNAFYQENILPRQNKIDGHEVLIIASTLIFTHGNSVGYTNPLTYYTEDGIKIIRIPYKRIINKTVSEKIRNFKGLYKLLRENSPDIIFNHGIGGYFFKTLAVYIKNNPKTKLYIDCHSDYFNSANNLISKYVLHGLFYRQYFKKAEKYAEKVFYVTPESIPFLKDLYDFEDKNKLQYLPLGGYIINDSERIRKRERIRKQLNIPNNDIVLIHSGKMDIKKKSYELISAFSQVKTDNIWLLILGVFTDDVYESVKEFIDSDKRIIYLGWKNALELEDYLCSADIYLQPGSRTVTVQNAVCCGCIIIVNPALTYTHLFGKAALYAETEQEIKNLLEKFVLNPRIIEKFQESLMNIAKEKLDYKIIANTYITPHI